MKLFSAIQNVFTGQSAPATPASQPTNSAPTGAVALNFRPGTNPPPPALDEFDEKFSRAPYLQGYWRSQQFFTTKTPPITPEIFEAIMVRAGGIKTLFDKSAGENMKALGQTWDNLASQLAQHSWIAVGQKFRDQIASMDENLLAGKTPPRLQSRDENLATVVEARNRIHELQRGLCHDVFKLMEPACLKLREVARAMVSETDTAESGHAAELGIGFEPSLYLRTLAYFAVCVAVAPINNYQHGSGFLPPCDLEKIWKFYVTPKRSAAPVQYAFAAPPPPPSEQPSPTGPTAEKLAELNKFNDEIRNQKPK